MDLITAPTVISIDPGGTTGWSVFVVHPEALVASDVPILTNITHRDNGQVRAIPPGAEKKSPTARELSAEERKCVAILMRDVISRWPGAVVLIEDFILRKMNKSRELLSPVRLTAALEWAIDDAALSQVLMRQSPNDAKTSATDARLRDWGLYSRAGGMEHARDADRHSITFLRKAKMSGGLRGQSWPHLYTPAGELRPALVG